MNENDITIRIGGVAGAGISATTNILARILKEHGYKIQTYRDIPSRIRGGHTNETVRASVKPCFSRSDYIDLLIAMDNETVRKSIKEMADGSVVIIDEGAIRFSEEELQGKNVHVYRVPATKLARTELKSDLYKNTIILGVITEMLQLDLTIVKQVIARMYGAKGEKIVENNLKALDIGIKYFKENIKRKESFKLSKHKTKERYILLTGNDAIALGALAGGCRFISGYPITPATQILERLIRYLPEFGGVAIQVEDEIAAINAAIGAALAGARAMTATSGPGFSLMTEGVSLAGMAEVPVVIVNSNRAGPSTGMPTKTEQSDLLFAIYQGHGEFPKVIIAPSTNEEAFYMAADAFNIAEKCQCPVILFVDEFISHGYQTAKVFNLDKINISRGDLIVGEELHKMYPDTYLRYKITDSGLSPRTIPMEGGKLFITTGLEHDEYGFPTEDEEMRVKMMDKRLRKLETLMPELLKQYGPIISGDRDAEIGIITFGSVACATGEAIEELKNDGIKVKMLRLRMVWPLPEKEIREFVDSVEKVFVIEMNATGQLLTLLRFITGPLNKYISIRKYDGRMFRPREIYSKIKEAL